MARLLVCPLRPGTQERWRRLFQELAGLRRGPFEYARCEQREHIRLKDHLESVECKE